MEAQYLGCFGVAEAMVAEDICPEQRRVSCQARRKGHLLPPVPPHTLERRLKCHTSIAQRRLTLPASAAALAFKHSHSIF